MAPAEDIAPQVVAAADKIAHGLLVFVEDVDGRQFGVAAVGLDPLPRAARGEGRRDHGAGDPERGELAVEVVTRHAGFIAGGHRAFAREPLEQTADLARVVRHLPQLGLFDARAQDPHHDLPLAVIERHVGSILLHDRPPIACGSVLAGTTHDYAIRQAGPSILSRSEHGSLGPPIPQRGLGRGPVESWAARSPCPALERRRRLAMMARPRPPRPTPGGTTLHEGHSPSLRAK